MVTVYDFELVQKKIVWSQKRTDKIKIWKTWLISSN